MPLRAHFPEELSQLEDDLENPAAGTPEKPLPRREDDDNNRGNPGFWPALREYWHDLKNDFGAPDPSHEHGNFIGDTGIDVQRLRKLQQHAKVSSLVGSSLLLSAPAMAHPGGSSPRPPSQGGGGGSGSNTASGTATPSTPWRRHEFGVDSAEVSNALHRLRQKIGHARDNKESRYVQSTADLAARRSVVLLLTYAFMLYGAPSHRIEDYVLYLFKVCGLDGRVNYLVGCTEICFINAPQASDPMTRYSYTTLVKAQGLDVGALERSFRIYKDVIHGEVSIGEAEKRLVDLIQSPPYYKPWALVPLYGVASAFVCIWAFKGYWTDMAVAFGLGSVVGFLQVIVASRNPLYTNVLEVTAALVTSFGARAFASIGGSGQEYFCFAAIAESSIATILPGYIVLCGALELQSKSVTAGSTRLFYAVIYSLFLGYGIDVGSQLWALIDPNAPTSVDCPRSVDPRWKILLVPCYLTVQAMLIRSRPPQIPLQVLFGSAAYTVNYFVGLHATAQVADTASSFTLGVLGHLYSRSRHGFAFASIIAGIMVLVPSGISAQGGLISGITIPLFSNSTTDAQTVYSDNLYQSFSVGAQMIQVAIGLSVGLLISALAIYPLGRKNNALFSF
jgi:uncharacterized membrane protein YjjP (DUF1212 family)/uncharacterized membrane protein YjjB (DUF3815 family)